MTSCLLAGCFEIFRFFELLWYDMGNLVAFYKAVQYFVQKATFSGYYGIDVCLFTCLWSPFSSHFKVRDKWYLVLRNICFHQCNSFVRTLHFVSWQMRNNRKICMVSCISLLLELGNYKVVKLCSSGVVWKWQKAAEEGAGLLPDNTGQPRTHFHLLITIQPAEDCTQKSAPKPWIRKTGRMQHALCAWSAHTMLSFSFVLLMTRVADPICVEQASDFQTALTSTRKPTPK